MDKYHVLVVDDEADIRNLVKDILEDEGFDVQTADSADSARKQMQQRKPDLILLDIWMSDEDGISLLKEWNQNGGVACPVLVMSGHGTVETAVEATRLGASAFIEKPLTMSKLLKSVHNALPTSTADPLESHVGRGYEFSTSSQAMRALRQQAEQAAGSRRHILISGEEGTRHLAMAEYIHSLSNQSDKPLMVFASAGNDVWEQGYGKVLCAYRAELSAEHEAQLIELLQQTPPAFLRIILFHAEFDASDSLLAVLNPINVHIPPLREHAEDVPKLINDSIDYCCQRHRLPYRKLSIAAQNYLLHYHWPGNLSELDALVYDLLTDGGDVEITLGEVKKTVHQKHLTKVWFERALSKPMREAREMFEKIYLERQLERVGGNISRLADKTDMERTHLYRKLRALGVRYKTGDK